MVIIKTPNELNIYENEIAFQVTELCESLKKVCLYPETNVQLTPGMNKVLVRLDPVVTGILYIKHSEQRKPLNDTDVLSENVSANDGHLVIKVINKTITFIALMEKQCIARAEVTEQSLEVTDNVKTGKQLTEKERASLTDLLNRYDHCFSGNGRNEY